jgi:hypothetical protein
MTRFSEDGCLFKNKFDHMLRDEKDYSICYGDAASEYLVNEEELSKVKEYILTSRVSQHLAIVSHEGFFGNSPNI